MDIGLPLKRHQVIPLENPVPETPPAWEPSVTPSERPADPVVRPAEPSVPAQ